jgi:N-acetylmuramoyl-L-alanine amidase
VLRAVEATPTGGGARVALVLSAAVRPEVRAVPGLPGTVVRLYVDLPAGTQFGLGLGRAVGPAGPVAGVRIGAAEDGRPRLVVELDAPARYAVGRGADGRVVLVSIVPAGPPAGAAAEARPDAARAAPLVDRARAQVIRTRPRIVIDPGHGGRDTGARGYAVEKHVTLAIARRLATLLATRLGAETVLTRTDDRTLPLAARTARANAAEADLLVSIHANASPGGQLRGIETYYLDNTDDRATIRLAHMENGPAAPAPVAGKADLRYILSDLVQMGKMEESIALAGAVQGGLVTQLRQDYGDVEDLGVKRGPFYVLVGAHMPCVLVETSFLTHPVEGRRLAGAAYREAVAEGLYKGIARFLADAHRAHTL